MDIHEPGWIVVEVLKIGTTPFGKMTGAGGLLVTVIWTGTWTDAQGLAAPQVSVTVALYDPAVTPAAFAVTVMAPGAVTETLPTVGIIGEPSAVTVTCADAPSIVVIPSIAG